MQQMQQQQMQRQQMQRQQMQQMQHRTAPRSAQVKNVGQGAEKESQLKLECSANPALLRGVLVEMGEASELRDGFRKTIGIHRVSDDEGQNTY